MKKKCLLVILICSQFFLNSCQAKLENSDIISGKGFTLIKTKNVTYNLPSTFRSNPPFTVVFYDKETNKEYITFGNDFATDSLYIFDLEKGGKPIQTTPLNSPTSSVKGVAIIALDSIFTVLKTEKRIVLLNDKGEITFSKKYSIPIEDSVLNLDVPSNILYDRKSDKIFFDIEINNWDYNQKSRLIASRKFYNEVRTNPWIVSIEGVLTDSLKCKMYGNNLYGRFIDSNYAFFSIPLTYLKDSNLFISTAYSDSVYRINHLVDSPLIVPINISSSYFERLKCKVAPLKNEENALSNEFLASRSKSNKISTIHYYEPINCFLVSLSSKAISFNDSGNPEEYDSNSGLIIYDEKFRKIGEFKFENIGKVGVTKSGVILKRRVNQDAPDYDPRKIKMEIYTLSR